MTPQEHELFLSYKWYIDAMEDVIVLIDGAENPVGIAKDLHMLKRMEKLLKEMNTVKCMFQKIPNTVTIVVIDHIGLLKTTKIFQLKASY
jgi:hypothetical protein